MAYGGVSRRCRSPADMAWPDLFGTTRANDYRPPADTSELLMEGEYVKLGETLRAYRQP